MRPRLEVIAGLGNPENVYGKTRHNAGFWLVNQLCQQLGGTWQYDKKLLGFYCNFEVGSQKVKLFKPETYMNHSGQAIASLLRYYQIPSESLLVAHDELDFEAGTIKIKFDGGHGGHNGLRDIISHLNVKTFYRCRIGIGHPGNQKQVHDYVLSSPNRMEYDKINQAIEDTLRYFPEMLQHANIEQIIQKIHTSHHHGI